MKNLQRPIYSAIFGTGGGGPAGSWNTTDSSGNPAGNVVVGSTINAAPELAITQYQITLAAADVGNRVADGTVTVTAGNGYYDTGDVSDKKEFSILFMQAPSASAIRVLGVVDDSDADPDNWICSQSLTLNRSSLVANLTTAAFNLGPVAGDVFSRNNAMGPTFKRYRIYKSAADAADTDLYWNFR